MFHVLKNSYKSGLATAALLVGFAWSVPLYAQDADSQEGQRVPVITTVPKTVGLTFKAAPLTAQQEARMPAAVQAVKAVMPEGNYSKLLHEMVYNIFDEFISSSLLEEELALTTGQSADKIASLSQAQREQVTSILDPGLTERAQAFKDLTGKILKDVAEKIEPVVRTGMERAYAVNFNSRQLQDINTFFVTETGKFYAAQSLQIFSADPHAMQASAEVIPLFLQEFIPAADQLEKKLADLPKKRTYSGLTSSQRQELSSILGITPEQLRKDMSKNK